MDKLWSGCSKDIDEALQLLYIVDIIRFWAEYTYKPTIATCLSRLQAIKAGESPVPFEDTLWKSQIALNEANTPWFFGLRSSYVTGPASPAKKHRESSLRERSSNRSSSAQPPSRRTPSVTSQQLSQPRNQRDRSSNRSSSAQPPSRRTLSVTSQQSPQPRNQRDTPPVAKTCVIPEIDSYNWLLDRDPGKGDLLLIRISENGTRRRPIVFFDSDAAQRNDEESKLIFADDMKRHHSDTSPRFKVDRKGCHYLWQCCRSKFNHIRRVTQFLFDFTIRS